MQVDNVTVKKTILQLDEDEAQWLNAQMQNPLHGQTPEQETKEDKDMREKFFKATRSQAIVNLLGL